MEIDTKRIAMLIEMATKQTGIKVALFDCGTRIGVRYKKGKKNRAASLLIDAALASELESAIRSDLGRNL